MTPSLVPAWSLFRGEAWEWLRSLPPSSADGLITDPPYSSGGTYSAERARDPADKYSSADAPLETFSGDNRDQRSYLAWLALWLTEAHRVLRDGAPVVVASDWRQLPVVSDALQVGGFTWRGIVTWTKNGVCRPQPGRFRNDAEFLIWASKGGFRGKGSPLPGTFDHAPEVGIGELAAPTIACNPVGAKARRHLTEKPVAMLREVVRIVPAGGLVLDPFAGSASAGVACLEEGRRYAGCELSERYAEVARKRLEEAANGIQSGIRAELGSAKRARA